jgi:hypothetical protein
MRVHTFSIQSRSRREGDFECFTLQPRFGVIALATGQPFDSTAASDTAARLSEEVISYVELGCVDSVANVPGLAKFESPARSEFTPARLVASARLANERLSAAATSRAQPVAASLAALHTTGSAATAVTAGTDTAVGRVRRDRFEWLVQPRAADAGAEGIGLRAELAVDVRPIDVEPGDIVGLGIGFKLLSAILIDDAARFDRALARCFAAMSELRGACSLFARWEP